MAADVIRALWSILTDNRSTTRAPRVGGTGSTDSKCPRSSDSSGGHLGGDPFNRQFTYYVPTRWVLLIAKPAFRTNTRSVDDVAHPVRDGRRAPCAVPLSLATRAIGTTDAALILDPFMGSGTTLRAAKDLGRKAIGIEL